MFFPEELTAERRDAMVEKAARAVVRRRLETAAVTALEMHKPLSVVGSTLVMLLTPLAAPFVTWQRCDELALFLMDRENVERLCRRIEALAAERVRAASPPEPRTQNPAPRHSPEAGA